MNDDMRNYNENFLYVGRISEELEEGSGGGVGYFMEGGVVNENEVESM